MAKQFPFAKSAQRDMHHDEAHVNPTVFWLQLARICLEICLRVDPLKPTFDMTRERGFGWRGPKA